MTSRTCTGILIASIVGLVAGCSTGSVPQAEGDALMKRAQASRQEWNKIDPQFEAFAKKGMAMLSSRRSPRAASFLVVPGAKASSTRKANTSATRT